MYRSTSCSAASVIPGHEIVGRVASVGSAVTISALNDAFTQVDLGQVDFRCVIDTVTLTVAK